MLSLASRCTKPFNLLPIPANSVLWLPGQDDAYSATIRDRSGNGTDGTIIGATWAQNPQGLWVIDHDGDDDYIEATCPQCNFTTGAFSGVIWVQFDAIGAHNYLICRGLLITDGWYFDVETGGYLEINTSQAGANQQSYSAAGTVTTGSWLCLGFTRDGAACKVYINGVDSTAGSGTHINPLTSARTLKIGIDDNLTNDLDGQTALHTIIGAVWTVGQHLSFYQQTRHLFGV